MSNIGMQKTKEVFVLKTIPSPGTQACGLAWDGEAFWYFDLKVKTLFRVKMNGAVSMQYPLGCGCCDTAYDGKYVWQAEPDRKQILVIDGTTGKVVRSVPTRDKTSGLCFDGANWYRGSWTRRQIIRFDPNDGSELDTIDTGASTSGLTWDGQYLWHGGEIECRNFLFKVDPSHGEIDRYPVDFTVCGLTCDGEYLWAADGDNNRFVQLQPE